MTVSYATNIRPLFRQTDIDHMNAQSLNLASYADVKTNAQHILGRLKGDGGPLMPPKRSGGPWSAEKIALFKQWIDDGSQP
jgi:hypothetical protein